MPIDDFEATPKTAHIHYGKVEPEAVAAPGDERVAHAKAVAPEESEHPIPVAVLVCHGMGQQVRFETIGQLASAILKEAMAQGCEVVASGVELSFQNESFLARAELNWKKPGGEAHCVHMYEAYWAPVTEGKVTYLDTVHFLFLAAWAGIKSSRFLRPCIFERYLFGGLQRLTISSGTMVGLIVVGLFLAAQVVAVAMVLARLAEQVKQIDAAHLSIVRLIGIFFPYSNPGHGGSLTLAVLGLVGWYLLVAEVFFVRYFLIQYAGDVAAYVSPYKASKFDDIRTRIQSIGLNVAKVVYGFGNTTAVPDYERVVLAGHSLGSVLAYDTLNAAINLDNTGAIPPSRRVAARTTRLITFGSPLDKTAFIFRNQSNHVKDPLREQMASAFQPLILEYCDPNLPLRERDQLIRKPGFWTNIYSPRDIISGSLDYYDHPAVPANDPYHVENIVDPDANIPLRAHVQYWKNPLLAAVLYDAVK